MPLPPDLAWLGHSVPLWSLLIAAFTSPATWSKRIAQRVGVLLDRIVPEGS